MQPPCDRRRIGVAPDVAAKRHTRYACSQCILDLADEAVLVANSLATQDDDWHRGALNNAAHALCIAGVEGLDIVGAHLRGLTTDAGDVLGRVLVGLIEATRDDLGLERHAPALGNQRVPLERGPLLA